MVLTYSQDDEHLEKGKIHLEHSEPNPNIKD